jgi:hypothetical protein
MNCKARGDFDYLKRFFVILVWPQGGLAGITTFLPCGFYSCVG